MSVSFEAGRQCGPAHPRVEAKQQDICETGEEDMTPLQVLNVFGVKNKVSTRHSAPLESHSNVNGVSALKLSCVYYEIFSSRISLHMIIILSKEP